MFENFSKIVTHCVNENVTNHTGLEILFIFYCLAVWQQWSHWNKCSGCSYECLRNKPAIGSNYAAKKEPVQTSYRVCEHEDLLLNKALGLDRNTYCHGEDIKEKPCDQPKMCSDYGEWETWTACDRSCGLGYKRRYHACLCGEKDCTGSPFEMPACNTEECPKLARWAEWDPCSQTYSCKNDLSCLSSENIKL